PGEDGVEHGGRQLSSERVLLRRVKRAHDGEVAIGGLSFDAMTERGTRPDRKMAARGLVAELTERDHDPQVREQGQFAMQKRRAGVSFVDGGLVGGWR